MNAIASGEQPGIPNTTRPFQLTHLGRIGVPVKLLVVKEVNASRSWHKNPAWLRRTAHQLCIILHNAAGGV